ncbi:MAG: bifunctional pyr operon transcriptional regulator/uracil phosphoribosyltransferase PyrR [Burkholderiaceae bacterium]
MSIPDPESAYATLLAAVDDDIGQTSAVIVGIRTGGAWVAQRLVGDLQARGRDVTLGFVSSAFHRDDYHRRQGLPENMTAAALPLSIDDKRIVLVDDVLYTGRTVRAALNELFDHGRPGQVRLAVLIDRGGRQLPFQPDLVGASCELADEQRLALSLDDQQRFVLALG